MENPNARLAMLFGVSVNVWLTLALLAIVGAFFFGYKVGVDDRPLGQALLNAAARARDEAMHG